jgi:hypothetical protein
MHLIKLRVAGIYQAKYGLLNFDSLVIKEGEKYE